VKSKINAKLVLLDHSKAKVELYTNYLATYLNILSRTSYVDTVRIYDLMCGEGIYADGSKGSPIIALEKIRDHYNYNKGTFLNLKVWFNDKGKSEIKENKYKIDRVEQVCSKIDIPNNVEVFYTRKDYTEIYQKVIEEVDVLSAKERALIFIDPYGYKEVKPKHLKKILKNGKTELILFLPISHMYRFMKKSLSNDDFPGGIPLQEFLTPLIAFNHMLGKVNSPDEFILQLKESFKKFLSNCSILVDTFTIERDSQNIYCLFFFTSHILGFEKMLETKWKIDEQQGKGFRSDWKQGALFTEIEISNYPNELKNFIQSDNTKTNSDLYIFGLRKGFLPKHTNQILKKWQKDNPKFKVYLENGNEARKNSFYLDYKYHHGNNPKKIVKFVFE